MKNGKKWISGLLAIACTLGMFAFGACKDDESEDDNKVDFEEEVEVVEFKLDYRARTLSLLETFQLEVRGYDNLTWSSSDSTIVSVDQNGLITANGYGTATITVVSGEYSDTCVVTVEDVGLVPTIQTNGVHGALALLRGDNYALDCSVLFNGKTYDDATFTFVSSDTQVATVSAEGVITALQQGETTVTITASWRNYETVLLTENLQVTVNPNLSIEFSLADEEIYTVSEEIDGVQYTNETDATWRIVLEDVDVTATTAVEFIYSEPSVVEVSADGKVTALKKGETEIAVQCTIDGKTYVSLGAPITVFAPEKSLTPVEAVVYATTDTTGLRIENLQGEFLSLSCVFGDFTDDVRVDGANISVYNTNFADMRGETRFFIETDVYTYLYDVIFATHTIATAQEFRDFTALYKEQDSTDFYAVLTADIDFENNTVSNTRQNRFKGKFNGMGHAIKNVYISGGSQGALFGSLQNATIENLALINVNGNGKADSENNRGDYLLAEYVYGNATAIRNVYVKGSYVNEGVNHGIVYSSGNTLIENCVVDITYATNPTTAYLYGREDTKGATVMNSYGVSNATTTMFENTDTAADLEGRVGKQIADILSALKTDVQTDGWSKYWSADEYGVYFGGKLIATDAETVLKTEKEIALYEYSETDKSYAKKTTLDIDLSTITDGESATRVFVGGEEVVTFENGTLHVDTALCVTGDNAMEISVYAGGKVFVQPYTVLSHKISTSAQFSAFVKSYGTEDSTSFYAVLTSDIDYDGNSVSHNRSSRFKGRFDGRGYAIKNVLVTGGSQGGLFGALFSAKIENLALINVSGNGIADGNGNRGDYLLGEYVYGTGTEIRNIYVKGSYVSDGINYGIVRSEGDKKIENCVVDITYANAPQTAYLYGNENATTAKLAHCYGVSNATTTLFTSGDTAESLKGFVGANMSDISVALKADVETGDGWSKYWSTDEYGVYFNGQLIATLGESVVNEPKRLATYTYSQASGTYTKQDTLSINLLELTNGSAIAKVFVNGVETDVVEGVLQLNVADCSVGEETLEILVYAGSKMITQRYTIASHEISTIDQFITFINGATNNDANLYAVLTADIDYDDKTLSINEKDETSQTAQFRGAFDGMGHTVSNWQVSGRGGVFGPFKGTVKNVAFVNIVNTRGAENNASGILFGYTYGGAVENVYVKGSFDVERAACGINSRGNEITWTNCVFDVTFKDGTASHSVLQNQKDSMLTNVYAIGNGAQLSTKVATAPYKTATALVSSVGETLANVSADDCWTIQNGDLYFGNTKVE